MKMPKRPVGKKLASAMLPKEMKQRARDAVEGRIRPVKAEKPNAQQARRKRLENQSI